jgi:hypothetical protein
LILDQLRVQAHDGMAGAHLFSRQKTSLQIFNRQAHQLAQMVEIRHLRQAVGELRHLELNSLLPIQD